MNLSKRLWAQLRVRLIVTFAAISLTTYLLSGYSLYRTSGRQQPEATFDSLKRSSQEITAEIKASIKNGDSFEAAFKQSELYNTYENLLTYDERGIPLGPRSSVSFRPQLIDQVLQGQGEQIEMQRLADGQLYMGLSVPLYDQVKVIGALTVFAPCQSATGFDVYLYPQLYSALIFSLVAIAGAGVFIGSNVSRVLREIEAVAGRIAQGEFAQRVRVTSNDEVGRLASTINEMASRLDALSQARARFLSKVSHELRTPLTIIKGFAITILRGDKLDPELQRRVSIIEQQADNLTRLVNDLLELARMDADRLDLQLELEDLAKVIESIASSFQVRSVDTQVSLTYVNPVAPAWALVDRQRMDQVFRNLIDNAFKHTTAGDQIRVQVTNKADRIVILVEDTGPGIPRESLPHIFERFYQADPGQEGMGLGLSVVSELVEAHGGTVSAQNLEKGCRFTVWLPRSEPPSNEPDVDNQNLPSGSL